MVEETRPTHASHSSEADSEVPGVESHPLEQRLRPSLLWGVGFLILLTISFGGAAYAGLRQGQREKARRRREQAQQSYETGWERLEEGDYELARAWFEYALELNPDHALARQGLDEAQMRIETRPTPTTESRHSAVEDLYEQALTDYQGERWREAAAALTQLRKLDSAYEAERVEEMLFTSFYNAGMRLLEEDRFEEGVFYLDQAVALRPLDEEARTQRRLAIQYMEALDYWGVDWKRCVAHFEELYTLVPDYKDVFRRLYRAHVNYGDAWYAQGEMCPAEEQYAQALQLMNSPTIEERKAQTARTCQNATPTPLPTIEGTEAMTMTDLPPGLTVGRIAYPVYDTERGVYDVFALFADDRRLMRMASGADQPRWVRSSGALGYRDRSSSALSLLVPGSGTSQRLASGAGLAWPTFSPGGERMAYAAQDAGGVWKIYVARTDGSAEPALHALGKGPAWGPSGLLAWTGCEEDDDEACGIFVDNPDDDQPATRLTASINDIGLHWAPGGDSLAYMSDHTGNWEIYHLRVTGGVTQLTDDPASDGLPAWAPDGSGLAFVSNRGGTWALYLMRPNGEDPREILTLGPNLPNWTMQSISWAP